MTGVFLCPDVFYAACVWYNYIERKVVMMDTGKTRSILHCDCNSFFASVELLSRPELRNRPVAVGGDSRSRHGIVLAKNEAAKKYGIKTAETLWQARKKCPDLIVLPPHYNLYTEFSRQINGIYVEYTDLVEPFGIDESWLDITNTYSFFAETPREVADLIRERVKRETGLTISVGVSFNKIFAKLGSDYKKPDATTEITPENFRDIVWKLPVEDMIFIGKSTQSALNSMGVFTLGQLAALSEDTLKERFGKHGEELYRYSNGLEDAPVKPFGSKRERKSVGSGQTFSKDLEKMSDIRAALYRLREDVGAGLRKHGLYANGVRLTIREPDFHTFTRQEKIDSTDLTEDIYRCALRLFEENHREGKASRALTVTAIDTSKEKRAKQISLFDAPDVREFVERSEKSEKLQESIDRIRAKFGKDSLKSGAVINNRELGKEKHNPFGDKG